MAEGSKETPLLIDQKRAAEPNDELANKKVKTSFVCEKATLDGLENNVRKLKHFLKQLDEEIKKAKDEANMTELLRLGGLQALAGDKLEKATANKAKRLSMIAPGSVLADFGIDRDMMHTFDLKRLQDRVSELFDWYGDNSAPRKKYAAPYFAFIQSSGMGKTKLLWELREWVRENPWDEDAFKGSFCCCETILCSPLGNHKEEIGQHAAFSYRLNVPNQSRSSPNQPCIISNQWSNPFGLYTAIPNQLSTPLAGSYAQWGVPLADSCPEITNLLNKILTDCMKKEEASGKHTGRRRKVILLFDESQHLLLNCGAAFQSVRSWLCRIRTTLEAADVVAVFAGTTLGLADVYCDLPKLQLSLMPNNGFYASGTLPYEPFWNLCTIGLFANLPRTDTAESDYHRAVPYGRPLFALKKDKELEALEPLVLRKMLGNQTQDVTACLKESLQRLENHVSHNTFEEGTLNVLRSQTRWSDSIEACFSILGTRLQMGHAKADIASSLVADGYAVLSHCFARQAKYVALQDIVHESVSIFFPTDPVCARLAMALMDETWWAMSDEQKVVHGIGKSFWTKKMTEIFAKGQCRPSQGGFDELAAAAYLLFCGDVLRKRIDATYKTFSVPLSTYIECLVDPNAWCSQHGPLVKLEAEDHPYTEAHVSFIQVTRNDMCFKVDDFFDEGFLRDLYLSGSAFYCCPTFPMFDLVAGIKLSNSHTKQETFVPLLVSIATKADIITQEEALEKILYVLQRNKRGGMGLRLLFEGMNPDDDCSTVALLSKEDVNCLLEGNHVSKALIVPHDDPFGVTNMLLESSLRGFGTSEVYASHSFLYKHSRDNVKSEHFVRKKDAKELESYVDEMRMELLESRTKVPSDEEE
jgi:hypothetical protein